MNTSSQKIWAELVAKAWKDEKFKEELLKHPEKVLREHGLELPKGLAPVVIEDTASTIHFILPSKHLAASYSKEDLKGVAGGGCRACGSSSANVVYPPEHGG